MRIAVLAFGQRQDPHIIGVSAELAARNIDVIHFDHYADSAVLEFGRSSNVTCLVNQLQNYDAVTIWPRIKPGGPWVRPELSEELDSEYSAEHFVRKSFYVVQWRHMLQGWFACLRSALPSVSIVNFTTVGRLSPHKPFQLFVANRLGVRIPETVITNNFETVRDKFGEEVLFKPLYGDRFGAEGMLPVAMLKTNEISSDAGLQAMPAIYQERIQKKYELRVCVVGERVVTYKVDSQSKRFTALDWRLGSFFPELFEEYELPARERAISVDIVKALGLDTGMLDFARASNGDLVFFECNPDGQWVWLEGYDDASGESRGPVTKAYAEMLIELPSQRNDSLNVGSF